MNDRPRVLLITGPGGSGKSTLAAHVAERLGWVCIGEDDHWVRNGWGHGLRGVEQERAVQEQVAADVLAAIADGRGVVLEFILYKPAPNPLTAYRAVLDENGVPHVTVALKPDVEEILERMRRRGRPGDVDRMESRRAEAESQVRLLESGAVDVASVIDSTEMTVGALVGECQALAPWATTLRDDSLLLRPLLHADVDEWLAGEDEELTRWFEFPRPATRDEVAGAIERWEASWRAGGPVRQWAVCERRSGAAIAGGVEVRDLGGGEVNLSYVVFPAFRRQGIATRASRLALDQAGRTMGATVGVIKVLEGNEASLGVARRLSGVERGREPSEAGGTFVVFRVALTR